MKTLHGMNQVERLLTQVKSKWLVIDPEGEWWNTTTHAFIRENIDELSLTEIMSILSLRIGERMTLGGGAAASFTVLRPTEEIQEELIKEAEYADASVPVMRNHPY